MTKSVPYLVDFSDVEKNEKRKDYLLYISVFITTLALLFDWLSPFYFKDSLIILLNSAICILAVLYYLLDIIANRMFRKAEEKRRDDLFDNSLNTKIGEQKSHGYFSNDSVNPGITKLGINTWENSYFSKTVSEKMLRPMIVKSIVVVILFLCLFLFANNKVINTLLQLALPYTILSQTYRLYVYNKGMESSFKKFQSIFSTVKAKDKQNLILHTVVNHEAMQSWACIKLNSKIFHELNDELSLKWEELKRNT